MKIGYWVIPALALVMVMSGCNSAHTPSGQSQVRQTPDTSYSQGNGSSQGGNASQTYGANQYGSNQSANTVNTQTGDNSGLGTSGTGGQTGSLGSSGGSPYIPPTGGKMPANTATHSYDRNRNRTQ